MPVIAVIGAGPGLGAAVARKFGREGFSVALISRNRAKFDGMAAELSAAGLTVGAYAADVRQPASLEAALGSAAVELGPITALQYSPLRSRLRAAPRKMGRPTGSAELVRSRLATACCQSEVDGKTGEESQQTRSRDRPRFASSGCQAGRI